MLKDFYKKYSERVKAFFGISFLCLVFAAGFFSYDSYKTDEPPANTALEKLKSKLHERELSAGTHMLRGKAYRFDYSTDNFDKKVWVILNVKFKEDKVYLGDTYSIVLSYIGTDADGLDYYYKGHHYVKGIPELQKEGYYLDYLVIHDPARKAVSVNTTPSGNQTGVPNTFIGTLDPVF